MRHVLVGLVALLLGGCAAADAYYEKGQAWETKDPSAAAEYYRLALAEDPNHPGARDRVTGFDFYGPFMAEAARFESKGEWLHALRAYDRVAELGFTLRACGGPAAPGDLESKRDGAMRQAGAKRFEEGRRAEQNGDHAAATRLYRECLALDPAHPEAAGSYKQALAVALKRLGVIPFQGDTPETTALGRTLADAVNANIAQRRPELIELVTRTNLDQILDQHDLNAATCVIDPATAVRSGKLMGLHLLVTGTVTVEKTDSGWAEQPGQGTKEIKDNDQVVKTLAASWVVKTRSTRAALMLSVQVLDIETGAVLCAERITRSKTAESRYARKVSGDDGALPDDVKGWCNNADAPPAMPDALVQDLLNPVADASGKLIVERMKK